MDAVFSCCGIECSACPYYPGECPGCPALRGQVFWLSYVDASVCPIYACCVEEKELAHCGQCAALPCGNYSKYSDPGMTEAESRLCQEKQVALLRSWAAKERGGEK